MCAESEFAEIFIQEEIAMLTASVSTKVKSYNIVQLILVTNHSQLLRLLTNRFRY